MTELIPPIHCKMSRLEALEGPTAFQAQFTCQARNAEEHLALDGSEFQIERDFFTVVPLESSYAISRLLALKSASGYPVDNETFFRGFASALIDMLRRGWTMFDQSTLVLLSAEQATQLGILSRVEDGVAPPPYDDYVVLERRFSKADHLVSPDE